MVKATRRREAAEDRAEVPPPARIRVTSLVRNRPLSFHFSGGSVRLGPLEEVELDRSCLSSPEFAHLVSAGAVRVGPAKAARSRAAEDDDSDSTTAGEK